MGHITADQIEARVGRELDEIESKLLSGAIDEDSYVSSFVAIHAVAERDFRVQQIAMLRA